MRVGWAETGLGGVEAWWPAACTQAELCKLAFLGGLLFPDVTWAGSGQDSGAALPFAQPRPAPKRQPLGQEWGLGLVFLETFYCAFKCLPEGSRRGGGGGAGQSSHRRIRWAPWETPARTPPCPHQGSWRGCGSPPPNPPAPCLGGK